MLVTKCYIANTYYKPMEHSIFLIVVDCKYSDWEEWNTCSQSCDKGFKSRARQILVKASNGGIDCNSTIEATACNTDPCPGV